MSQLSRHLSFFLLILLALTTGAASNQPPRNSPLQAFSWQLLDEEPFPKDEQRGNYVSLIDDGYEAFLLRVHLIRNAEFSIDIQTFILEDDECGRYLTSELIKAAERGVKVRMLVDHFMSSRDQNWVAYLASVHPNLEMRYYRPPTGQMNPSQVALLVHGILFFQQANQRMHNKLMVIDGAIALAGGRNIDNHYYNNSLTYNFIDLDALVLGPLLPRMHQSFEEFWKDHRAVPAEILSDVAFAISEGVNLAEEATVPKSPYFDRVHEDAENGARVQALFVDTLKPVERLRFLSDKPGKNKLIGFWGGGKATRQIRKTIHKADDEIVLQSPYLILNTISRFQFRVLRYQHPDLDIIVSTNSFAATDNTLAYSANYKLRTSYIKTIGMDIFEYMPYPKELPSYLPNHDELVAAAREAGLDRDPFLSIHAKAFVLDNEIGYVGSYNIDPRSDNLNTELGLLIEDPVLVGELRELIIGRTQPENSWFIAEKAFPLADVNYLVEGIFGLTPLDIWPIRNTSSFELLPGKEAVSRDNSAFYENYKDVGSFPGAEEGSVKQLTTSLYKVFNSLAIPIL